MIDTFIFDLDGTLVEDHLVDKPCDRCEGTGTESVGNARRPRFLECRRCHGKLRILVPRRDRHYTDPVLLDKVLLRVFELRRSMRFNARFALATNQGGVAMGFQTEDEVRLRIARTLSLLDFFGGAPLSIHYCLHHPEAKLEEYKEPSPGQLSRRKPEPGMLIDALLAHGREKPQAIYIGDRETDQIAAERAGIRYASVEDWLRRGQQAFPNA